MNPKRKLYNEKDSANIYLILMFAPIAVSMIFLFVTKMIALGRGYEVTSEETLASIISVILSYLAYVAVYFLYNRFTKTDFIKASSLKIKFGWWNLVAVVIIALVTLFGLTGIINVLTDLMKLTGYQADTSMPLPLSTPGYLILNIFLLAVLPAILEELVFRGVVFSGLRKYGNVFAVLCSAFLFALAHGSAVQTIYQFVLGAVLGVIVWKTGSVIAAMVVHFVNNFTVILVNYIQIARGVEIVETSIYSYTATDIVLSVVFAILTFVFLWISLKFLHKRGEKGLYLKYKEKKKTDTSHLLIKEDNKVNVPLLEESKPVDVEVLEAELATMQIEKVNNIEPCYNEEKQGADLSGFDKTAKFRLFLGVVVGAFIWIMSLFM